MCFVRQYQSSVGIDGSALISVNALALVLAVREANTLGRLEEDHVGNSVPAVGVVKQLRRASGVERVIIDLELTELSQQTNERRRTRATVEPESCSREKFACFTSDNKKSK